jgi:hypothetical protein
MGATGSKGAETEGSIARWYPGNARRDPSEFKALAKRMADRSVEEGSVLHAAADAERSHRGQEEAGAARGTSSISWSHPGLLR